MLTGQLQWYPSLTPFPDQTSPGGIHIACRPFLPSSKVGLNKRAYHLRSCQQLASSAHASRTSQHRVSTHQTELRLLQPEGHPKPERLPREKQIVSDASSAPSDVCRLGGSADCGGSSEISRHEQHLSFSLGARNLGCTPNALLSAWQPRLDG